MEDSQLRPLFPCYTSANSESSTYISIRIFLSMSLFLCVSMNWWTYNCVSFEYTELIFYNGQTGPQCFILFPFSSILLRTAWRPSSVFLSLILVCDLSILVHVQRMTTYFCLSFLDIRLRFPRVLHIWRSSRLCWFLCKYFVFTNTCNKIYKYIGPHLCLQVLHTPM